MKRNQVSAGHALFIGKQASPAVKWSPYFTDHFGELPESAKIVVLHPKTENS